MRIKLNRKFESTPNTVFHDIAWKGPERKYMIAVGWALIKGDWWWMDKPGDKPFFWYRRDQGQVLTRWGVYFGRLALTFMRSNH